MQQSNQCDEHFQALIRDVWAYRVAKNHAVNVDPHNNSQILDKVEYALAPFNGCMERLDDQLQVVGPVIDLFQSLKQEQDHLKQQYNTILQAKEKAQDLTIMRNMIYMLFADGHVHDMYIGFNAWQPVLHAIFPIDDYFEEYKRLFRELVVNSWIIRDTIPKWHALAELIRSVLKRTSYCRELIDRYNLHQDNHTNDVTIFSISSDAQFFEYCDEDTCMYLSGELPEIEFVTNLRAMTYNEIFNLDNHVKSLRSEYLQFMAELKDWVKLQTSARSATDAGIIHQHCLEMYTSVSSICADDMYTYNGATILFDVDYTLNEMHELLEMFRKVIVNKRDCVARLNFEISVMLRMCNPADIATYHAEESKRINSTVKKGYWSNHIHNDILTVERHLNERRRV